MLSEDILQAAEEEWTLSGRTYTDETADSIKGQKLEFDSIHFVRCRFTDCDFTGASFCNVVFDKCDFSNSSFEDSYWKNTRAEGCKGDGSRFSNASFKWVKLSDCTIDNIMVSDQYTELAGVKVNLFQAAELAKLMGVKIV